MHSLQAKALPFRRTAGSLYSGLRYDFFSLFVFLAVNESIKCTFAEQNMECQLCRNGRTSEILQKTMRSTLHNRPKCIQVDLHLLHIQQPPTTTAIVVVGGCFFRMIAFYSPLPFSGPSSSALGLNCSASCTVVKAHVSQPPEMMFFCLAVMAGYWSQVI